MTAATDVRRSRAKTLVMLVLLATALLFLAANAHLLYVALDSEPACVDHVKVGASGTEGSFTAAESAC
jgi:hypothetical protein